MDVDTCRAVAAATLGDASKVSYTKLSAKERFTVLQSGAIDMLGMSATWTLQRDAGLGSTFAGVIYYDGQGFMVRKELGLHSAKELNGAVVCVTIGTTTERNLADFFTANKLELRTLSIENSADTSAAGTAPTRTSAARCTARSRPRTRPG